MHQTNMGQKLERIVTVEKRTSSSRHSGAKNVVIFKVVHVKFMESLWVSCGVFFFWSYDSRH